MDYPGGVRANERVGDLDAYVQSFIQRERLLVHQLPQGLAVYELSSDEMRRGRVSNLVDGDDVRMTEGRRGAGFPFKPAHAIRVDGEMRRQNFQRDVAF